MYNVFRFFLILRYLILLAANGTSLDNVIDNHEFPTSQLPCSVSSYINSLTNFTYLLITFRSILLMYIAIKR